MAQALGIGVPGAFQPGQIQMAILSQALHQPEADHSQGLICIEIDRFHSGLIRDRHGPSVRLCGRYRLL